VSRFRVTFSPEADAQLVGLYNYIADRASPDIAKRFTDGIVDYCESFETFPERGLKRDDLRRGLRLVGFRRRATIAFNVAASTVVIVGVFYGGQDIGAAFEAEG
jgi:toxin ParE1/3/4